MKKTKTFIVLIFILTIKLYSQPFLDYSFGQNGKVVNDIDPSGSSCYALNYSAIQMDGKIVSCGSLYSNNNNTSNTPWQLGDPDIKDQYYSQNIFITRHNVNGSLDTSFGLNGITILPGNSVSKRRVFKLILQPDGKIITLGALKSSETFFEPSSIMINRFNSDGSLDTSFGNFGYKVLSNVVYQHNIAYDLILQNDGKIIIAGVTKFTILPIHSFVLVIRLTSNGQLDGSFDGSGYAAYPFPSCEFTPFSGGTCIKLQSNNKIIIGGYTNCNNNFLLMRINENATLDTTFGINGFVESNVPIDIEQIEILPDDSILAVGVTQDSYNYSNKRLNIAKVNINGILDNTFGVEGINSTILDNTQQYYITNIKIKNGEKIVLTGYKNIVDYSAGETKDFYATSYNIDGTIDNAFGTNGEIVTDFNSSVDRLYGVTLMENDEFLLIGESSISSKMGIAMAKYSYNPLKTEALNFAVNETIVFPNPTKSLIHFKTKYNEKIDKIQVFEPTGKQLLEINNKSNEVNVQELRKGVYFINLYCNDKVYTTKFIKE